jgi:flagellar hook-basal body complex protein FliE
MADIGINELLAQMQRLAANAQSAAPVEAVPTDGGFAELMKASVDSVNEAQMSAANIAAAFERGDAQVSLPEVMIALQKASLSFQAMTEVRNQLVSAYQDIMNMPI